MDRFWLSINKGWLPHFSYASRALLFASTVAVIPGCTWLADTAANNVYSSLEHPFETEAPPTFAAYRSSMETEAIIGGEGRGIDCSIPWYGDVAFKQPPGVADIRLRFRQACVNHDFCYRHGLATYGYTQNDCDIALQESAYRLCRQIQQELNSTDAQAESAGQGDPYGYCETEAKKVLLGVALGGSGSYKGAGRSTYFEFDPMPARADNYVIARALPSGYIAADSHDLGIRAFLFKHNAVTMTGRQERDSPKNSLAAIEAKVVSYPADRIATPPQIAPVSPGSPLAALARTGFTDTSLDVEIFTPSKPDSSDSVTGTLTIARRSDVVMCRAGSGVKVGCDVSMYTTTQIDGGAEVLSLTHRGSVKSGISPKVLERGISFTSLHITHDLDTQNVHNTYRFLVHDMLVEKDAQGDATHAWVFARGVGGSHTEHYVTDDAAAKYSEQVLVTRQKLGNAVTAPQRFMIDATEKNEPLSLVRVSKDGTNALIGLQWSEKESERRSMAPTLKTWLLNNDDLPKTGTPVALMDELRDCYMEMPPIIARFPQMNDAQMFFPRVTDSHQRAKDCATLSDTPDPHLRFDVLLARLHLDSQSTLSAIPNGAVTFDIDLGAQLNSAAADIVKERANRSFGEDAKKKVDPSTVATWNAAMRDLNNRWRGSQVIASERISTDGEQEVALTVVFNGFTGMSFQLLFHVESGDALRFDRIAGGEDFIRMASAPVSAQKASIAAREGDAKP